MIDQTTVLNQIEQLVQRAKQNPSDANVREQLTAVKALCEVVLQSEGVAQVNFSDPVQTVPMPQQRTLPKRSDIEQQNDSIFDF